MTDPDSPLWRQITDRLRAEIAETMAPGDRLPSEAQLAARFGVNRHTLRRALAALADEGLVRSRRGAGVFVAQRATEYPISRRVRFHKALSATGRMPGRRILSVLTAPANEAEAEALQLAPGEPVVRVEGVSFSDGVVIAHFRSSFPSARLPGMAEAIRAAEGVTAALAACGVPDYVRASTRLNAQAADALLAGHLALRRGDPVMRTEAINTTPEGVPVEFGETFFAGDRVTLTVTPD